MEDTIAAVATPVGQGGIGIIRLSGVKSTSIAAQIFRPARPLKDFQSHRLYLGHIVDPSTGSIMDEVLLSFMRAPHSYTREDVVEINSHSGYVLLSKILQIVLQAGARLARPGEFTFRAFMNGRIDLTQAEAVADVIRAKSEKGLILATRQIRGEFRTQMETLRERALAILARIEAAIDFPEETSLELVPERESQSLDKDLLEPLRRLIAACGHRKVWVEGIRTVIVGRVNAGKSSLLNRLLNEQRALVSPIPGTTRDTIESTLHMEGIPLKLMDTAGFRKGKGKLESLGIRLTEQRLAEADLVLSVVDQSRPLTQDDLDILARCERNKSLILLNKIDLPPRVNRDTARQAFEGYEVIRVSASTGEGMDELRAAIVKQVLSRETDSLAAQVAPNLRHKRALEEAYECFQRAKLQTAQNMPLEIVASDMQAGLEALGEIVGAASSEDVLDRIFSEFCIGK